MVVENIFFSVFTVLSAALLMISLLAFRRSSQKRMLILAGVFAVFLVKGILLTISLFLDFLSVYWLLIIGSGTDSLALILLYLTTLKV